MQLFFQGKTIVLVRNKRKKQAFIPGLGEEATRGSAEIILLARRHQPSFRLVSPSRQGGTEFLNVPEEQKGHA